MLNKILKYRANIWLTAGAILLIFSFLISAIVVTSKIDPLYADANMAGPERPRDDKRWWSYIPGFGRYNYQEPTKSTNPTNSNSSTPYNPRFGPK